MKQQKINHLAVWILVILIQTFPIIWYDNIFFGIRWAELNNLTAEDFENFGYKGFIVALIAGVALVYALAWLFIRLKVASGMEGVKIAFILWLGLIFLEITTQNMFTLRPFELTLIDEGVVLMKYEFIGIVLGVWKKFEN